MFNGLKKNRTHMFFLPKRFNITIILSFKTSHWNSMTKCETLLSQSRKKTPKKTKKNRSPLHWHGEHKCLIAFKSAWGDCASVFNDTVSRHSIVGNHGNFLYSLAHTCISNTTCKIRENLKTGSSCAFWCLFWFYFPQTSFHLKFEGPTRCHAMSCR